MTDHDALAALLRDHAERAWPAQLAAIENGGGWDRWDHAARFLHAAGVRVTSDDPTGGDAGLDLACDCENGDGTSHPKYHAKSCPIALHAAALTGDTPNTMEEKS